MNPSSTTPSDSGRQVRVKLLALAPGLLFTLSLVPFGTTRETERPWLALGASLVGLGLLWRAPGARWPSWARAMAALTAIAWAWCALAFLPTGPEARAWLQPALAPLVDRALALTGETVRPLALSPWRGLMEWSLGGALMALAAGVASRTREVEARRRLLLWLVGSGLAVLFVAWVHRAQGAPSIWWVTGVPAYKREPFFAPFASANHAGALLAALVPLAGGLALAGPLHARRFGAGALLALGIGVVATGARAAFVDTVVGLYVLALLVLPTWGRRAGLGLGLLSLAALPLVGVSRVLLWITAELAPRTYDAIEAGYSDLLTGRGDLYADALRLLGAQPWFGVGSGGFDLAFRVFKSTPEYLISTYAHEEPLQFAIEHGVVGLGLVAAAWVALVMGGAKVAIEGAFDEGRAQRAALLASVLAVTVDATVDFPLRIGAVTVLLAVVVGALVGSASSDGPAARGPALGVAVPSLLGTAAALLLMASDPVHSLFAPASLAEAEADAMASAAGALPDPAARRAAVVSLVPTYEEAVLREPLGRGPLQKIGRASWYLGDFGRAEEALMVATAVHPTLPWPWRDLAKLRLARGDIEGAAAAYKQMLSADLPDDPMRLVAAALNVEPDVHAAADKVLPERADRWVTAAVLADQREDREEAERLLRHAMTLNPRAGLELAGMYARWGRPQEAAKLLMNLEDSCRKSLLMGDVLVDQDQDREAEGMYEDALKRCGARDRRARFGLGRVRLALGDPRGLHALEALVKEDPSDRLTLRALVKELEGQGRLLEARQVERLMDQGQKPEAEPDEPEVPER